MFDPTKIPQETVDKAKPWLQIAGAEALSSKETLPPGHLPDGSKGEDITTKPEEIFVGQYMVHPTDVNPAPFEVYIQAGRSKGRNGDKVQEILGKALSETSLIPNEYLGEGQSCIFVTFHEENGFGFIPRRI